MPQVELSAGTIHYEDTGGRGAPIVFLHGLIMDHTQWRHVVPALPEYRCILPTLPLGGHRIPMPPEADLTLWGMVNLVADFLDALELGDVTLVCSDWGGGLLLPHIGRDQRIARLVICSAEAFDNFPPGVPGKLAALAARVPGGIPLALRQLRSARLRRLPFLFGWMTKRGVPDEVMHGWTQGAIASAAVRRDLRKYAGSPLDRAELVIATEGLARFDRPALVLWGTEDRVMPPEHGRRLAELLPQGRLVEIDDAYVLLSEDQPEQVAAQLRAFLAGAAGLEPSAAPWATSRGREDPR